MKKVICFFLIFISVNNYSQTKKKFTGYDIFYNNLKTKKFEIRNLNLKSDIIKTDSIFNTFLINSDYDIFLKSPSLEYLLSSFKIPDDSIYILGNKFSLQCLLKTNNELFIEIKKIKQILFDSKEYVIIEGTYEKENYCNYFLHWILILNVSDKKNIKIINKNEHFNKVFCFSEDYLGDIDSNGIPDICLYNNDELLFFNINDKSIQKIKGISYKLIVENGFYYFSR